MNKYQRFVAKCRANGLCIRCGKDKAKPNRTKCLKCMSYRVSGVEPRKKHEVLYGGPIKITEREYHERLAKQENGCAICGKVRPPKGRRLAVDHDHETGKVRGLLCARCNIGLGYFKDNEVSLRAAAVYVEASRD